MPGNGQVHPVTIPQQTDYDIPQCKHSPTYTSLIALKRLQHLRKTNIKPHSNNFEIRQLNICFDRLFTILDRRV